MNIVKNEMWSTPIWEIDTGFDSYFNLVLAAELDEIIKKTGTTRYNIWEVGSKPFAKLKEKFKECLDATVQDVFPPWYPYNPYIDFGWGNKSRTGEDLPLHSHEGYIFVMNYYVKCPPNCGDLLVVDPRGGINWGWETETQSRALTGIKYKRIKPVEGKLVIFPAFLMHMVEPNRSKEDRISIATNVHNYPIKYGINTVLRTENS